MTLVPERSLTASAGGESCNTPLVCGDRGELENARKEIEDALGFFEASRATLASRELWTSFFSSKHAYYDLAVSVLMPRITPWAWLDRTIQA